MGQYIYDPNSPTEKHRKSITTGTQEFSVIIENQYIFVDKTSYISQWISHAGGKTNLFHRPRRFGKTLTLSVLKEIYNKNKILFKDTQLTEEFWGTIQPRPVLNLSLAARPLNPVEGLENSIKRALRIQMKNLGIFKKEDSEIPSAELFSMAIERLEEKNPEQRPVILIDEYDSLLVQAYQNGTSLHSAADIIANYIYPLKYQSSSIHAAYVIGIMKCQGLQLMSAVNNPVDYTFTPEYAQMIGFTMEEIRTYFTPELEKISLILDLSMEELLHQIKINYNGYSFSDQCIDKTVYAGFSLCNFMYESSEFRDYWYSTGGINILYTRAKNQLEKIKQIIDSGEITGSLSELKAGQTTVNENDLDLTTLLFYHGYLTFKGKSQNGLCKFGFPNDEVKRSFSRNYAEYFFKINSSTLKEELKTLKEYIETLQIDKLMHRLSQIISIIPGTLHSYAESYYHTIVLTLFYSIYGSAARAENPVAGGIPDLVLDLPNLVYIFEFKYVPTHSSDAPLITELENAARQVLSKEYSRPYSQAKQLFSIAMVLSGERNNLAGYKIIQELTDGIAKEDKIVSPIVLLPWEKIEKKTRKPSTKKTKDQANLKKNKQIPSDIEPINQTNDIQNLIDTKEKEILALQNKVFLAEAEARSQKAIAEAETRTKKAEALAEKAKAEAEALAEKAKAEAKALAEKFSEKMKLIWRLKSAGTTAEKICEFLEISAKEWKELTGEDLTNQPE